MDLPPRRTLLAPWLPEKGAAMVYAPRGLGKTFFALSVAYAVASGATLLRWRAPEPRRVLYIDGEMPLGGLQERLAGIAASSDVQPPTDEGLRFLPADHYRDGLPDLASPDGRAMVEGVADGVDLLVLDNLSTLASGKENESDGWQAMQDLILSLRRRGTTTLMVHHAGKGGGQRGTSRREDVLDAVIALRRPDDYDPTEGARFEVHFEKSRGFSGAEAKPFEARLQSDAQTAALTWQAVDLRQGDREAAFAMFAAGEKPVDVAKALDIGRATAFRWQKDWRDGNGDGK
jgi:putative DNA primase/helicase